MSEPNAITPFFIHIPKNMGTFIYKSYYEKTNHFYGMYDSIQDYYKKHDPHLLSRTHASFYNTTISIDHLTPVELMELGLLTPMDLERYVFFAIVREPIDRFISLCNYWNIPPFQMIYNINQLQKLKQTKYNLFQHLRPQSDYVDDIKQMPHHFVFSMNKKDEIKEFMSLYFPNQSVDFNQKKNPSKNCFHSSMLSNDQIRFLQNYYKRDIHLFHGI
jgi:hypothetical protein